MIFNKILLLLLLLLLPTNQQCAATTTAQCGTSTCTNYYWNTNSCQPCSSIQHTNTTGTNTQSGSTYCLCLIPYSWDSSSFTCIYNCTLMTNSYNCGQTFCNNYFWNGSVCVSCSQILNAQSYSITAAGNVACSCIDGFIWDGYAFQCKSCTQFIKNQTQCGYGQCSNFAWNGTACIDCQTIANTRHYITTSANNNICLCQQNSLWNGSSCASCKTVAKIVCGGDTCNNYYWNGTNCLDCSEVGGINYYYTTSGNTKCSCVSPALWSSKSFSCFSNCANAIRQSCGIDCIDYYWNGANCIQCSTISFTTAKTTLNNGQSCSCQSQYTWQINSCVYSGSCLDGKIWDSNLLSCVCSNTQILVNGNCFNCSVDGNQTGIKSDANHCQCNSIYYNFDTKKLKCICNSNSIWLNNTCVSCNNRTLHSIGIKISETSCQCPQNWTWSNQGYCQCDSHSILIRNKLCWNCANLPFTTNIIIDQTHCGCQAPYTWSSISNNCTCNSNSLSIYRTDNQIDCFQCNTANNASQRANLMSCRCLALFIWNPILKKCLCQPDLLFSKVGMITQCINCRKVPNGVSKFSNMGCTCSNNYIWNQLTAICEPCSNYPNATSKAGPFSCGCNNGYIWQQMTYRCV